MPGGSLDLFPTIPLSSLGNNIRIRSLRIRALRPLDFIRIERQATTALQRNSEPNGDNPLEQRGRPRPGPNASCGRKISAAVGAAFVAKSVRRVPEQAPQPRDEQGGQTATEAKKALRA